MTDAPALPADVKELVKACRLEANRREVPDSTTHILREAATALESLASRSAERSSVFTPRAPFQCVVDGPDVLLREVFPVVENGGGWIRVVALAVSREAQEQACRALNTSRAEGEWRSIDSAPKDGTSILIIQMSVTTPTPVALSEVLIGWFYKGGWRSYDGDCEPTHWQPLPAPPPQEGARLMPDLSGLIERLEAATGPDRDLDIAIWQELCWKEHYLDIPKGTAFSASVDSALALAVKLVGYEWPDVLHAALSSLSKKYSWHITFAEPAQLAELPLAILLALLRALGSRHE